jgi:oligopeptide/dipeptide ABC transporter ATP-binding protein
MTNGIAAALEVSRLSVSVTRQHHGETRLVDDVSFSIAHGETYGLVGESGSGKSLTALAVMGLLRRSQSLHVDGSVRLLGRDLRALSAGQMAEVRGRDVGMVFQDPMSSLNPAYSVGEQIAEALRRHRRLTRKAAWGEAIEILRQVDIPGPAKRANSYSHELSGGMRQRAMLAMAVACRPKLLIADEPTTALDVTVQAQILALLRRLQQEIGMAVLFITHDLAVLADIADRVGVMYAGQLVEEASVFDVFERTKHPYTSTLLRSSPEFLGLFAGSGPTSTHQIASSGCRFQLRCEHAREKCEQEPMLRALEDRPDQLTRCLRVDEIAIRTAGDLWLEKQRIEQTRLVAGGHP